MRNAKLRKKRYESAISQIEKGNIQSQGVLVIDNSTGETKEFSSIRKGQNMLICIIFIERSVLEKTIYIKEKNTLSNF